MNNLQTSAKDAGKSLVGLLLWKKALTSVIFGCLFHLASTDAGGCHFCAYSTLLVQTGLPYIHVLLQCH